MNLVKPNDTILKTPTKPFDFSNPPMLPSELFHILKETMCKENGVGLSACQIGLPYSVFIVGNPADPDTIIPVFNPKIVDYSEETDVQEEGCLTFPGLYVKVRRSLQIRARYTTHENVTDTIKFSGFTARVFQHEFDHLQGIVYKQRANRYHLEQAMKQKNKLDKLRKENMKNVRVA